MRPLTLAIPLLLLGCGRDLPLLLEPTGVTLNARSGPDAGSGCGTLPFGPDCCEGGLRVSSASCVADSWVCTGDFCTCAGKRQDFQCAEFCGSDAFGSPECVNGEWSCARPTRPTSRCSADTCWGEPGDCCGAPSCVDGGWVCAYRPSGC
ncbi:MAG: hypothetical protein Q8N23_05265 [Archangium sp.]|nr:hypothetical protein [Archangium sp.]MDP3152056.1 hypothetical protein [Archangium sp.]MDP3575458.1 hypothetical protein [Archangium sp.]